MNANHYPPALSLVLALVALFGAGAAYYQVHEARFDFAQAATRLTALEERHGLVEKKVGDALAEWVSVHAQNKITEVLANSLSMKVERANDALEAATLAPIAVDNRVDKLEQKLKVLELAVEPLRFSIPER